MYISHLKKKMRKTKEQADKDVSTVRLNADSKVALAQKAANTEIESMRVRCENEKRAINDKCNETVISIKKDCERQIQHIKEDIESERATLSKMNEKELLIRIMLALNGYGNRLDRLEQNLADDKVVDRINNLFEKTTTIISGVSDNLIEQIDIMNDSSAIKIEVSEDFKKFYNNGYELYNKYRREIRRMTRLNDFYMIPGIVKTFERELREIIHFYNSSLEKDKGSSIVMDDNLNDVCNILSSLN